MGLQLSAQIGHQLEIVFHPRRLVRRLDVGDAGIVRHAEHGIRIELLIGGGGVGLAPLLCVLVALALRLLLQPGPFQPRFFGLPPGRFLIPRLLLALFILARGRLSPLLFFRARACSTRAAAARRSASAASCRHFWQRSPRSGSLTPHAATGAERASSFRGDECGAASGGNEQSHKAADPHRRPARRGRGHRRRRDRNRNLRRIRRCRGTVGTVSVRARLPRPRKPASRAARHSTYASWPREMRRPLQAESMVLRSAFESRRRSRPNSSRSESSSRLRHCR